MTRNDMKDTKEWIRAVARYLNLSLSDLALKSGLAASTVTRFVNDPTGKLTVTEKTLDAISRFSGIPKYTMPGQRRVPGLGVSEAVLFDRYVDEPVPDWVHAAIETIKAGRQGVEAWMMKGWALDMLGILPGDILIIDRGRRAKAGDIVLVEQTDLATGKSELVLRRYEPPYVLTHSSKMGPQRPEAVDDERVLIMGVETGIIRPRH